MYGVANCTTCGAENTVVPAEIPPADEGGVIMWVCTNCNSKELDPERVQDPFYGKDAE